MNEPSRRFRDEGYWRDDLLTDHVRSHAERDPSGTAIVDGARRLSWAQLWAASARCAQRLRELGVSAGEVVSTQLPNGAEIVALHLATELVGAAHNPLAVQFREYELGQVADIMEPTLVIHPGILDGIDYGAIHAGTKAGRSGRAIDVSDCVMPGETPVGVIRAATKADEIAFILNTSGTVSIKGVAHSHQEAMFSTRTVAGLIGIDGSDTVMCAIPMTWGGGLAWGVRFALHAGATLVSLPRWDPQAAASIIDEEGVTFIYGPPTLARDLVSLADVWRPEVALKMICAGAPIPREICRKARDDLGVSLFPGYGQTEHLHSTVGRRGDPEEKLVTTDGRALPGVEVRAVDDDGAPCPALEVGNIECRGPNVGIGYYRQPELSGATFKDDGWQVTQDLGSFDSDGYLRVAGRKRDIIIRGGLNVSPREVEELLVRHPDVREAAVVGYPDPRYGERICAFVVPFGSHVPSLQELTSALSDMGVARYKHPERVERLESLPLTTTGKVRHESLREMLRNEEAASS